MAGQALNKARRLGEFDGEYDSDSEGDVEATQVKTDFKSLFNDIRKDSVNDDDLKKRIKECRLPPPDEDHNGKETILHSLVNFINDQNLKKGAEVEKYKPLVKIVLEHDFSLMEAGDKEGRTALLVAIRDGRIRLLELFLEVAGALGKSLTSTIAKPQQKQTCLHEAISKKLSMSCVQRLIQQSDECVLKAKDGDGNTPLHLLVKYENFCHVASPDVPNRVVEGLVGRWDQALSIENSQCQTPIQLLRQNRKEFNARTRVGQETQKSYTQSAPSKRPDARTNMVQEMQKNDTHTVPYAGSNLKDKAREDHGTKPGHSEAQEKRPKQEQGQQANRENEEERLKMKYQKIKDQDSRPIKEEEIEQSQVESKPKGREVKGSDAVTKMKSQRSTLHSGDQSPATEERFPKAPTQGRGANVSAQRVAGTSNGQPSSQKTTFKMRLSEAQILTAFGLMEDFLNYMILRSSSNDDAKRIIHGSMPGDELDFNLLGVKRLLDVDTIKQNYAFLKFEKALQYVALPRLRSNILPSSMKEGSKGEAIKDSARLASPTQYLEVFNWLKAQRNVSKVLEIIIEDDPDDPHSDTDIQNTVRNLGVETWNWRKYDISSDTIVQAAPEARKVYLYTTGNKAVLREWSGKEGLRRLKDLRKVVLHVAGVVTKSNNIEIPPEIEKNISHFKSRLLDLIKRDRRMPVIPKHKLTDLLNDSEYKDSTQIDCEDFVKKLRGLAYDELDNTSHLEEAEELVSIDLIPIPSSQVTLEIQDPMFGPVDQKRAHRWIKAAQDIARWMSNSIEVHQTRIKVGLIDDGVDASHDSLNEIIKMGVTYCPAYKNGRKFASSYYASTTGHGTLMAILIRLVCPFADLYVAKLDDYKRSAHSAFTTESAAKAIDWAVSMGVDVISMSWTMDKTEQTSENVTRQLDEALQRAYNKGIVMLCAARDEGVENPGLRSYPAAGAKDIFRIGAAAPTGISSEKTNREAVDFLFPGTELRDASSELKYPEMPAVDGSSSATALASGLVALLLFILSMDIKNRNWRKMRYNMIQDILKNVVAGVPGEDKKYVQVWQLFERFTQPKTEGDCSKLQDLIDHLYSKTSH